MPTSLPSRASRETEPLVWLRRGVIAVLVTAVVASIGLAIVNGPHIRAAREAELARVIDEENRSFCAKFGAGPETGNYADCAAALNGIRSRLEERILGDVNGIL